MPCNAFRAKASAWRVVSSGRPMGMSMATAWMPSDWRTVSTRSAMVAATAMRGRGAPGSRMAPTQPGLAGVDAEDRHRHLHGRSASDRSPGSGSVSVCRVVTSSRSTPSASPSRRSVAATVVTASITSARRRMRPSTRPPPGVELLRQHGRLPGQLEARSCALVLLAMSATTVRSRVRRAPACHGSTPRGLRVGRPGAAGWHSAGYAADRVPAPSPSRLHHRLRRRGAARPVPGACRAGRRTSTGRVGRRHRRRWPTRSPPAHPADVDQGRGDPGGAQLRRGGARRAGRGRRPAGRGPGRRWCSGGA